MEEHTSGEAAALSATEILDQANDELNIVLKELKAARKVLARDWESMTPRERSNQSRVVKDLEQREATLLETLDMYRGA